MFSKNSPRGDDPRLRVTFLLLVNSVKHLVIVRSYVIIYHARYDRTKHFRGKDYIKYNIYIYFLCTYLRLVRIPVVGEWLLRGARTCAVDCRKISVHFHTLQYFVQFLLFSAQTCSIFLHKYIIQFQTFLAGSEGSIRSRQSRSAWEGFPLGVASRSFRREIS